MSDSNRASCSQGTRASVPCFCFAKSCFCYAEVLCYAQRTLHFVQGHVLRSAKHMTFYTTFPKNDHVGNRTPTPRETIWYAKPLRHTAICVIVFAVGTIHKPHRHSRHSGMP